MVMKLLSVIVVDSELSHGKFFHLVSLNISSCFSCQEPVELAVEFEEGELSFI